MRNVHTLADKMDVFHFFWFNSFRKLQITFQTTEGESYDIKNSRYLSLVISCQYNFSSPMSTRTSWLHSRRDDIQSEEVNMFCDYFPVSRVEQADLTLVVVDCAHVPTDAQQAAAFLQEHLRSVLPAQEQTEPGIRPWHLHLMRLSERLQGSSQEN